MTSSLQLRRHCVQLWCEILAAHAPIEAECEAVSIIWALAAVDRLPVVLWSERRCGVSAYYVRRDPSETNYLAGLEALLGAVPLTV